MIQELQLPSNTTIMTSPDVFINGRTIRKRDVVWLDDREVAEVWFFAGVGDDAFACVSRWATARVQSASTLAVHIRDAPEIISVNKLLGSLIYRRSNVISFATVLLPITFQ